MATFLKARWEQLIMANYAVPAEALLPYLPTGVELDLYDGKALVSLVGFMFNKNKIFNLPIPLLGSFEEINLRFYVKRTVGNEVRRGVVFINETVPYKPVAWLANWLYKEHYDAVPTRHNWNFEKEKKTIQYDWKKNKVWHSMIVEASIASRPMEVGTEEHFIFEHYYGYTRVNQSETIEYKINHPSWMVNDILDYKINCEFDKMYGETFSFLNAMKPNSVFLAEGSSISVDWKRRKI